MCQESCSGFGIGKEEYGRKWDLGRICDRNLDPYLGLERRDRKENGICAEFVAGIPAQFWDRRDMEENGICAELLAEILTQFWDWRGET